MCPSRSAGCCPYLESAPVSPRSAGNGPGRLPGADLAEQISHLYVCQGLSTYRIAGIVGIDRQRVGRLLHRAGVPIKACGAGLPRRPVGELAALAEFMESLYVQGG